MKGLEVTVSQEHLFIAIFEVHVTYPNASGPTL